MRVMGVMGVMYSSLGFYIKFSFLQVPKPAPEESEGSDEVEEPSPPRRKPKPASPPRKEAKTGHFAFADKLKKSRWTIFFLCCNRSCWWTTRSFVVCINQNRPFFPPLFPPGPLPNFLPIAWIVFGTNFFSEPMSFLLSKELFWLSHFAWSFFLLENCGIIFCFKKCNLLFLYGHSII